MADWESLLPRSPGETPVMPQYYKPLTAADTLSAQSQMLNNRLTEMKIDDAVQQGLINKDSKEALIQWAAKKQAPKEQPPTQEPQNWLNQTPQALEMTPNPQAAPAAFQQGPQGTPAQQPQGAPHTSARPQMQPQGGGQPASKEQQYINAMVVQKEYEERMSVLKGYRDTAFHQIQSEDPDIREEGWNTLRWVNKQDGPDVPMPPGTPSKQVGSEWASESPKIMADLASGKINEAGALDRFGGLIPKLRGKKEKEQ